MWCKQCRQDVPGIVCGESGEFRCPRCAEGVYSPLDDDRMGQPLLGGAPEVWDQPDDSPPRPHDDWQMDDQLEHIGRVLHSEKPNARAAKSAGLPASLRIDAAHPAVRGPFSDKGSGLASPQPPQAAEGFTWMSFFTWTLLSLGLMAFVCGGVLLGWSIATGRQQLWTIGLPTTLGGQIALLVGLILQLDRLWLQHRSTAAKLNHFDDELHELKTTASTLGDSQASAGADFYAHLVDGAGPQLLLTDLKSQLDLLAAKIGKAQ